MAAAVLAAEVAAVGIDLMVVVQEAEWVEVAQEAVVAMVVLVGAKVAAVAMVLTVVVEEAEWVEVAVVVVAIVEAVVVMAVGMEEAVMAPAFREAPAAAVAAEAVVVMAVAMEEEAAVVAPPSSAVILGIWLGTACRASPAASVVPAEVNQAAVVVPVAATNAVSLAISQWSALKEIGSVISPLVSAAAVSGFLFKLN